MNVESILELDSEGASTPMGPSGPRSKLIYHDDIVYESWIDFRFIPVHQGTLVITQDCIDDNKQCLYIVLID